MIDAEALKIDVARHDRILRGEDNGSIGLVDRMETLEQWRIMIDNERRTVKALGIGICIGLGLNGIGIIAILTQLTGV